jgi:hypothetical protein
MTYGHTPEGEQNPAQGSGYGSPPPPYPEHGGYGDTGAGQQGYGQTGYGQNGYEQPGYGYAGGPGFGYTPSGSQPPTYKVWGIIAAACGVLFNLILGFPAAMIGSRQGRKSAQLWSEGDTQGAAAASRKARGWLIAASVLDVLGLVLFVVIIAGGSASNFSNPSAVASSIKSQISQRLSDSSSQYYDPSLKVTSVVCTKTGANTDNCVNTFSNGQTSSETAVISGDGQSYTTH